LSVSGVRKRVRGRLVERDRAIAQGSFGLDQVAKGVAALTCSVALSADQPLDEAPAGLEGRFT